MEKPTEAAIYENAISVVEREMKKLTRLLDLPYDDLKRLELLTKIYATLKDDLRNDIKAGIAS